MTVTRSNVLLPAFVAACLCFAAPSDASTVELKPAPRDGSAGTTIVVPLAVTGARGLGGIQFRIVFDPALLELDSIEPGPIVRGSMIDTRAIDAHTIRVAMIMSEGLEADTGDLLVARFILADAAADAASIELIEVKAWNFDDVHEMIAAGGTGTIAIAGPETPAWLVGVGIVALALITVTVVARRAGAGPGSSGARSPL